MTIRIPKKIFGTDVSGETVEKVLAGTPEEPRTPSTTTRNPTSAPALNGYIYVPTAGLYFAKERTHLGEDWQTALRGLAGEGLEMPTPLETWALINYLKGNLGDPESKRVYDDILEKRDPWRGEWQNAIFNKVKGEMYMWARHFRNGKIENRNGDKLASCLEQDCLADFNARNLQGLMTARSADSSYKQGENIYFWHPREGAVAWFSADSDRAGLSCSRIPAYCDDGLGVRAVRRS